MNITPVNNNQSFSARLKAPESFSRYLSADALKKYTNGDDLQIIYNDLKKIKEYGTDADILELKRTTIDQNGDMYVMCDGYLNGKPLNGEALTYSAVEDEFYSQDNFLYCLGKIVKRLPKIKTPEKTPEEVGALAKSLME